MVLDTVDLSHFVSRKNEPRMSLDGIMNGARSDSKQGTKHAGGWQSVNVSVPRQSKIVVSVMAAFQLFQALARTHLKRYGSLTPCEIPLFS